jgi:hypothetical protein
VISPPGGRTGHTRTDSLSALPSLRRVNCSPCQLEPARSAAARAIRSSRETSLNWSIEGGWPITSSGAYPVCSQKNRFT